MKVVQINATYGIGSTGKICVGISQHLTEAGIENYTLFSSAGSGHPLGISCSSNRYIKLQAVKSRLLGNYGFNSKQATKKMISHLEQIQPDIVHLHNIHGHDCHLETLLQYLKKRNTKIVWTFHDCWLFTGYCTYFDMANCNRWQTKCQNCPQRKKYSFFFDKSMQLHQKKRRLLDGLNMTIVTPSQWLGNMVNTSFLQNYPVKVIYNGIDLSVFKPTQSDFRKTYRIPASKKIVLGVAFGWDARKGLDVFIELSHRLDPDKYQIVLVGTDKTVDKQLPPHVISIHATNNQAELAEIYTVADVFVNPTREEVLGMTNIEANACGTPVITFRSGGSPECIDATSGIIVEKDDVSAMETSIKTLCQDNASLAEFCRKRAEKFDKSKKFMEYIRLYEAIMHR